MNRQKILNWMVANIRHDSDIARILFNASHASRLANIQHEG